MQGRPIAMLAALCSLLGACDRRDDLDGQRRKILESASGGGVEPAVVRPEQPVAFSLIDNRAGAVVTSAGRTTVWADGARLVPFIDGNLRAEWTLAARVEGAAAARIRGRIAHLFVPLDDGPGGVLEAERDTVPIALRLHSLAAKQVASVFVNEVRIGDIRMPEGKWVTRTIEVPRDRLVVGDNRIRLYFRHLEELDDDESSPGYLQWATIGGSKPVARSDVEGSATATPRQLAWSVAAPARISIYARVPRRSPRLRGAVRGKGKAEIAVAAPSGRARTLWTGKASGAGTAFDIDLTELAGQPVRIDLHGGTAELAWIEPAITAATAGRASAAIDSERVDHIIVWSISSLRADRIGDKTAALAQLQRSGLSFASAWSPAPSPPLAHSAVLTGRVRGQKIDDEVDTLATILGEAGYATALISGNGFINDDNGFARGFDVYRNPMRLRRPHSARVLWQLARRFLLKRRKTRTFVYMATSEPHLPYTPTDESLEREWGARPQPLAPAKTAALATATASGLGRLTGEQKSFIRALYDAEVRDADRGLATALEDLEKMQLAADTALVVFGDHGEELFEDGDRFGHGGTVSEAALRVPLLIRAPGRPAERRQATARLADLFPTVLALAGIDPPPSAGRSLLGPEAGDRPLTFRTSGGTWALRHAGYTLTASPDRGTVEVESVPTTGSPSGKAGSAGAVVDRPVAARFLRTALSFAVAFDDVWLEARWGDVANHGPGFAADQGI